MESKRLNMGFFSMKKRRPADRRKKGNAKATFNLLIKQSHAYVIAVAITKTLTN